MKYEPCEEWEEPRSFDVFLGSPQFVLHPWPERVVPLDEAMFKAMEQAAPAGARDLGAKQTKKTRPQVTLVLARP
jgi:hypothetical protein